MYTFPFDDAHLLARRHHNAGAVWVTPNARPGDHLPLFIYLHGLSRRPDPPAVAAQVLHWDHCAPSSARWPCAVEVEAHGRGRPRHHG